MKHIAFKILFLILCFSSYSTASTSKSFIDQLSPYSSKSNVNAVPIESVQCSVSSEVFVAKPTSIDCVNKQKPDSYVLALSWSPQYCAGSNVNSKRNQFQCIDNRFGFVVHGLWPQLSTATKKCSQPRNCGAGQVDIETIKQTMCVIPSSQLIQDQWQKHGSCSGLSSPNYFKTVRQLNGQIKKPDLSKLVQKQGILTAGDITQAFVKANKEIGLPAESVVVRVGSRNAFQEVFVCYDLSFKFTTCSMTRTPDNQKIWIQQKGG